MYYSITKKSKKYQVYSYNNYKVTNNTGKLVNLGIIKLLPGQSLNIDLTDNQYQDFSKILKIEQIEDDSIFYGIEAYTPLLADKTHSEGFLVVPSNTIDYTPMNVFIRGPGRIKIVSEDFVTRIYYINDTSSYTLPVKVRKVLLNGTTINYIVGYGITQPLGTEYVLSNKIIPASNNSNYYVSLHISAAII